MASRTFLSEAEHGEAQQQFKSLCQANPQWPISVRKSFLLNEPFEFSRWLGEKLHRRLKSHALWAASRPVALGSWARDELCARSDIDLLFLGEDHVVKELVDDFSAEGLKLRYRVPFDREDWTVNVEPFDILALLSARPFFAEDQAALDEQKAKISGRGSRYLRSLCKAMFVERAARAKRYDSIANYLEPNLKHGAGGLRDLEQGLLLQRLFGLPAVEATRLRAFKSYFLMIRHSLHIHNGGDVLVSSMQKDLAEFLRYPSIRQFMSELEYSLHEVSFFADWYAELVRQPQKKKRVEEKILKRPIHSIDDAFSLISQEPSLSAQKHVRDLNLSGFLKRADQDKSLAGLLQKHFHPEMLEEALVGFFRSRLMSRLIPDLERVTGLVQHDQYHRYSVDAHTLQATREVLRVKKRPKNLGVLAPLAAKLNLKDWEILLWTALYHDLGKGREGDHSTSGARLVKKDFVRFGLPLKLTTQVAWLVQNHLILSQAAFRRNIQDPTTWADLFKRGVRERRIDWLTLFTAIDIRATNPDAWNDWKQKLLLQLSRVLESPMAGRLNQFLLYAEKKGVSVSREFIDRLDPMVVEALPPKVLLDDYQHLFGSHRELAVRVERAVKGRELWVRLHSRIDRPGLFVEFASLLNGAGLNVQEAFVQTYSECGAYDWFKVKSDRTMNAVRQILKQTFSSIHDAKNQKFLGRSSLTVKFATIELVSENESTITVSFRGRDQRGAMLAAATAIYEAGFEITSAKVHTWGRQIDDVFTLKKPTKGSVKTQDLERVFGHLISV
jgi:[protein-PII] uridylyltransferase